MTYFFSRIDFILNQSWKRFQFQSSFCSLSCCVNRRYKLRRGNCKQFTIAFEEKLPSKSRYNHNMRLIHTNSQHKSKIWENSMKKFSLKKFYPDLEVSILPLNSDRRMLNRRWDLTKKRSQLTCEGVDNSPTLWVPDARSAVPGRRNRLIPAAQPLGRRHGVVVSS